MVRYLRRTNSKLTGEITPQRAARMLGVHVGTVYRWCQVAVDGDGPLVGMVRKSITGWYYIDAQAIEDIAANGKPAPDLDEKKPSLL